MPKHANPKAEALRALLAEKSASKTCLTMPCHGDALSAKLVYNAGFPLSFLSGYFTAATLGLPDTGVLGRGDMLTRAREVMSVVGPDWLVIGDGDTGGSGAYNVSRLVQDYAKVGFAGVMIEDQAFPKQCGHTLGKQVVSRHEAITRIKVAVDARNSGMDMFILARTDAAIISLDEAIARCQAFHALGADMTFLEAPLAIADMERYCSEVRGFKMANMIEGGKTPILAAEQLGEMGFVLAAYPVTLLSASIKAMRECLEVMKRGERVESDKLLDFPDLCSAVGFDEYFRIESEYK